MSARHHETFDVLTSPDGAHTRTLTVSCATPLEHYARTTTATPRAPTDDGEDVCCTGLRVYEGAQVLAAFIAQYGVCLLPRRPTRARHVLELGCGCALAGLTAALTLPHARVVFTDAAVDCLAHVRASGAAMRMTVCDATACTDAVDAATHCTYPLRWHDASVDELLRRLCAPQPQPCAPFDLLVGSDLMYYRVDMAVLLRTCARLLCAARGSASARGDADAFVVFAHAMRVAGGRATLARAARRLGFVVAAVMLDAFVCLDVVQRLGWGGLEVVLLLHRPAHGRRSNDDGDDDDGDGGGVADAATDTLSREAADDVAVVREALWRRCGPCTHEPAGARTGDGGGCAACARSTRQTAALCAHVVPYPDNAHARSSDRDATTTATGAAAATTHDARSDAHALLRVLL